MLFDAGIYALCAYHRVPNTHDRVMRTTTNMRDPNAERRSETIAEIRVYVVRRHDS